MRFFLPLSNDPDYAEQMYEGIRQRFTETREPPTERRIYVLKFHENGRGQTIAVGNELRRSTGEPVIAILEGSGSSTYYVCTPKHGAFEGEPHAIASMGTVEVEEFSAMR
ncbi:MAG TPA: hypothetical protein VFM77_20325 [Terriglobales bacterium]|nr:hypothetical protein [Terriglobales bacterium]